jgi:hypothetical protein
VYSINACSSSSSRQRLNAPFFVFMLSAVTSSNEESGCVVRARRSAFDWAPDWAPDWASDCTPDCTPESGWGFGLWCLRLDPLCGRLGLWAWWPAGVPVLVGLLAGLLAGF